MPGRYLIISDIHSNYYALRSVLKDASDYRWDECWCLGDVVGYGPHPDRCLEILRDELRPVVAVLGNHDAALINRVVMDAGWADDAKVAIQRNRRVLGVRANRAIWDWASEQLNAWQCGPHTITIGGIACVATHGTIDNPLYGSVGWSRHEDDRCPTQIEVLSATGAFKALRRLCVGSGLAGPIRLFVGHTHVPTYLRARQDEPADGGTYTGDFETIPITFNEGPQPVGDMPVILNPGSVGQPRDCDPRAAYVIYDSDNDTIEFRRVEYPIPSTQRAMEGDGGYPRTLIDRLAVGK